MDDLLTVKQAAILLKVHHLTIRRYLNEGKLKAVRIAGNVRVSQQEIRNFQESYSATAKAVKSTPIVQSSIPFSPNDSIFRLKGRGLSLDR